MDETHELYKFQLRKQDPTENIETYVAVLRQLGKNCNFGQLQTDQFVVGVRDDCIRGKLQSDKQLTLDRCLQIGKTHENSKQQTKAISPSVVTDV